MAALVARLAADPAMVRAFTEAFPESPQVNGVNLAKAIATYERTFVSPKTRFDRWIAGDEHALTPREVAGFRLFTGKAGCIKCHSGFAFTDHAFYDIGLPGEDRGRGAVLRLEAAEHAFKTPGLREIARSVRSWAERRYHIVHWTYPERGGHFAVCESRALSPYPFLTLCRQWNNPPSSWVTLKSGLRKLGKVIRG